MPVIPAQETDYICMNFVILIPFVRCSEEQAALCNSQRDCRLPERPCWWVGVRMWEVASLRILSIPSRIVFVCACTTFM